MRARSFHANWKIDFQEKYWEKRASNRIVRRPRTRETPLHYLIDILRFGAPYLRRY